VVEKIFKYKIVERKKDVSKDFKKEYVCERKNYQ
jgi:hypothetical protein